MAFIAVDDQKFLEPPHCHDPSHSHSSQIYTIPSVLLQKLPSDVQTSLLNIQESTSVAFASFTRLQDLYKERFHRLIPAKKQDMNTTLVNYSEPAFHSYVGYVQAEKIYFLEEALPDWRHKAMRIDFGGQHDMAFPFRGKQLTLQKWWAEIQAEVEKWEDDVEDIEIPDFEETLQEYRLFQAKEIRKNDARNERNRRRKTMLDTERPELGERKLEKVDSAVLVD